MKCPNCGSSVRPEAPICQYCGHNLRGAFDPRVERATSRDRDVDRVGRGGRGNRYGDDGYDDESDEDDGYVDRRGRAAPPSRGAPTSARGGGRSPDWDAPLPGADDSIEGPAYDPREPVRRSGRGINEPDEDLDADEAYDDRRPRAPRPPSRRADDYDVRSARDDRFDPESRGGRGSRPQPNRFDDPLEDPRAPGFLKDPSAPRGGGRSGSSSRNDYGAPAGGRRPPNTQSRRDRQDFDEYPDEYPDEPRRGGSTGRGDPRYGSGSRMPPRRTPSPPHPDPLDDSFGMSAFPGAVRGGGVWDDSSREWSIAPSEEFSAAQPGLRGPAGGRASRSSRDARRPVGREDSRDSGQRAKFIALGVLLAALLLGGGVFVAPKLLGKGSPNATTLPSAFATYTPGATPTPAANYTLFTSKRSAYILTYPQDWSATEQPAASGDNLDIFAGQGGMPMFRVEQATGFANATDDNIITGEVQSAKQAAPTATYTEDTSAATTAAIGGEQWARREFDVTNNGVKYRMAILSCHHHGKGYVIVLVTAPADFAKYGSGAFKTMLDSFRFVG